MGLYKNWREKRARVKSRELNDRLRDCYIRLKESQEELDAANKEILSKPCPINNMELCKNSCVHFEKGFVAKWGVLVEGRASFFAKPPRCKLWGCA